MIQNYNFNFNLNKFFKKIILKKQYLKKLEQKTLWLKHIKEQNYKKLNYNLVLKNKPSVKHKSLVSYIITISFSRSNTTVHVIDFSGVLKFCYSAGNLSLSGKNKTARTSVFKAIARVLGQKLRLLRSKPIALHLRNVGFKKFWIINKLKKKLFIKCIQNFNIYPHNGCRKKKVRRKKIKERNGWVV